MSRHFISQMLLLAGNMHSYQSVRPVWELAISNTEELERTRVTPDGNWGVYKLMATKRQFLKIHEQVTRGSPLGMTNLIQTITEISDTAAALATLASFSPGAYIGVSNNYKVVWVEWGKTLHQCVYELAIDKDNLVKENALAATNVMTFANVGTTDPKEYVRLAVFYRQMWIRMLAPDMGEGLCYHNMMFSPTNHTLADMDYWPTFKRLKLSDSKVNWFVFLRRIANGKYHVVGSRDRVLASDVLPTQIDSSDVIGGIDYLGGGSDFVINVADGRRESVVLYTSAIKDADDESGMPLTVGMSKLLFRELRSDGAACYEAFNDFDKSLFVLAPPTVSFEKNGVRVGSVKFPTLCVIGPGASCTLAWPGAVDIAQYAEYSANGVNMKDGDRIGVAKFKECEVVEYDGEVRVRWDNGVHAIDPESYTIQYYAAACGLYVVHTPLRVESGVEFLFRSKTDRHCGFDVKRYLALSDIHTEGLVVAPVAGRSGVITTVTSRPGNSLFAMGNVLQLWGTKASVAVNFKSLGPYLRVASPAGARQFKCDVIVPVVASSAMCLCSDATHLCLRNAFLNY